MNENVSEISDYEKLILQHMTGSLGLNMPWSTQTIDALNSLADKGYVNMVLDNGVIPSYSLTETGLNFSKQKGNDNVSSE